MPDQRRRVLLGALLATPLLGLAAGAEQGTRQLRFTLTFSNPLQRALEGASFWCYLPADLPGAQQLRAVTVSAHHTVQADALGHRILSIAFDAFPALGQKVVSLAAIVDFASGRDNPVVAEEWLDSERFIESGSDEVRTLAARLRTENTLSTARAIYDWVRQNLHYAGYLADDLGALYALRNGRGDCTEYADLVVALARASGIPARMAGGYVIAQDAAPRPQDYHNWAELYLDGAWRTVDAQKECWLVPAARYVVFRIYRDRPTNNVGSAHRYRVTEGLQAAF
jgi:hypothetical protein